MFQNWILKNWNQPNTSNNRGLENNMYIYMVIRCAVRKENDKEIFIHVKNVRNTDLS